MWGATGALPLFGLGWRVLFPVYTVIAIIAILWLGATPIEEEKTNGKVSSFGDCFGLLRNPFILMCFLAIMCHVGIDVGTNTTAPKILQERLGFTLDEAAFATSLYFIFRTIGCLTGSIILQRISTKRFMAFSVVLMLLSMIGMMAFDSRFVIYTSIALVGYGNSNVFSMAFSEALIALPDKKNEVSGLMIMGLFGGTLFPLAMGYASDTAGSQTGAVAVMTLGVIYLIVYTLKLKK
jgi:fucose permease